ncbi:phage protease [Serratia fonticola]|uniref:phage protease n=1 Tax=Serratia fonticola TaxID=47917 RepID=UPI001646E923|nr:phage protease [Serratia fonticola]MBC3252853.1 phage protease [Serratia fonticola]
MKKTLIAYCSQEIAKTGNEFMLFPVGEFRGIDGRPAECKSWVMNAALAQVLIAQASARKLDYVTDYEHQTLRAKENGQPAPASGWFHDLEWREGVGLFAVNVKWTAAAAAMIASQEYRYISPVFSYDKNGNVTGLLHAALTNTPALDDMDEVLLAAASLWAGVTTEEVPMDDDLLERLQWLLNLPVGSTIADVITQLDKIKGQLGTAAASFNLEGYLQESTSSIAALSQQVDTLSKQAPTVDLSQYVPIAVLNETVDGLHEQIAALTSGQQTGELETLITAALSDGRIVGQGMETWLRDLGKTNMPAVQKYLDNARPIAALTQMQTTTTTVKGKTNDPVQAKDPLLLAVCSQFGNDPAVISKALDDLNNEER